MLEKIVEQLALAVPAGLVLLHQDCSALERQMQVRVAVLQTHLAGLHKLAGQLDLGSERPSVADCMKKDS